MNPVEWILTHIDSAFRGVSFLNLIGSFGLAVIALTLLIRVALIPLYHWQLKATRKSQATQIKMAPKMAEIRNKYKGDFKKIKEETDAVYKKEGESQYSAMTGCLPMLLQLPILSLLFYGIKSAGTDLSNLNLHFLWIPNVTKSPLETVSQNIGSSDYFSYLFAHPAFLILPFLAALASYVQAKVAMLPQQTNSSSNDPLVAMSQNVAKLGPIIGASFSFFFALSFPQGVALYWVTQSVFLVIQQYHLFGWGQLEVPSWFPGAKRHVLVNSTGALVEVEDNGSNTNTKGVIVGRTSTQEAEGRLKTLAVANPAKGGTPPKSSGAKKKSSKKKKRH